MQEYDFLNFNCQHKIQCPCGSSRLMREFVDWRHHTIYIGIAKLEIMPCRDIGGREDAMEIHVGETLEPHRALLAGD